MNVDSIIYLWPILQRWITSFTCDELNINVQYGYLLDNNLRLIYMALT